MLDLVENGGACRESQEALGGQNDQGFAPFRFDLASQQVEVLGWGGGLSDNDVVLRGQEEQSFQSGAAVFGSLAFESVWQEHNQSAESLPLVLGTGDELVDDALSNVPEIPELSLPHDQSLGAIEAISIFKA